jgi:MFS family permease
VSLPGNSQVPRIESSGLTTEDRSVLLALMAPMFMLLLMEGMFGVALPGIQAEFNLSISLLSWITGAAWLARVPLAPLFGSLADRVGIKEVLLSGTMFFVFGSVLGVLGNSVTWLLIGRLLQGVGAGAFFLAMPIITRIFPFSQQGYVLGLWNVAPPIGSLGGPILGGLLVEWLGWRSLFVVASLGAVIAFWAIILFVPRISSLAESARHDWLGSISLSVVFGGFLFMATSSSLVFLQDSIKILLWIPTAVALGIFIWDIFRTDNPVVDGRMLIQRRFVAPSLAVNLRMIALDGGRFLLFLYFAKVIELAPRSVGIYMLAYSLPLLITIPIGGILADRAPSRIVGTGGLVVQAAGLLWLGFSSSEANIFFIVVPMAFSCLGAGMALIAFSKEGITAFGEKSVGFAAGLFDAIRFSGSAITTPLLGLLLTALQKDCCDSLTQSPPYPYIIGFRILAVVAFLGAVIASQISAEPHKSVAQKL